MHLTKDTDQPGRYFAFWMYTGNAEKPLLCEKVSKERLVINRSQ